MLGSAFAGLLIADRHADRRLLGRDPLRPRRRHDDGLHDLVALHIVAALEWRDPYHSIFNRATIANGRFNLMVLIALVFTFLATTIDGLQRILDTVDLTGAQWRVCFIAVLGYLVLAELGKVLSPRGRA